ncbi:MAG: hypothetical protein WBN07_05180, partial [Woeseiaceae bacterium]
MATIAKTSVRDELRDLLAGGDRLSIEEYLAALPSAESIHAVFNLTPDEQRSLLSMISAERAADLIEDMPEGHAADLIEDMPATLAAPIVEEMSSDQRVDVLAEMDKADADTILEQLDEEDASEIRGLIDYPPDVAGGLMMTEFASFPMDRTVRE